MCGQLESDYIWRIWKWYDISNLGIRSVGRARAQHARGRRYDSGILQVKDKSALIAQLGER